MMVNIIKNATMESGRGKSSIWGASDDEGENEMWTFFLLSSFEWRGSSSEEIFQEFFSSFSCSQWQSETGGGKWRGKSVCVRIKRNGPHLLWQGRDDVQSKDDERHNETMRIFFLIIKREGIFVVSKKKKEKAEVSTWMEEISRFSLLCSEFSCCCCWRRIEDSFFSRSRSCLFDCVQQLVSFSQFMKTSWNLRAALNWRRWCAFNASLSSSDYLSVQLIKWKEIVISFQAEWDRIDNFPNWI